MQGMGILFGTREPFWTLTPPNGVERKPHQPDGSPQQPGVISSMELPAGSRK